MTIDLTDTTTGKITAALVEARQRLGGPAMGMVLNLVIVTDEASQYDAMRAASLASREHPCRVIGVINRDLRAEPRVDAEIRVGETGPSETVLLRLYGPVIEHADSVVEPLLVLDIPALTWWPGPGPAVPSAHPLGAVAQRRVTDAAANSDPLRALATLAASYRPGDTDLAWTRATPWRSLLAATLDQPHNEITSGTVAAEEGNPTAALLAAWLAARLGVPVQSVTSDGPGITEARFSTTSGDIAITRPDGRMATQSRPDQPDRRVALHRREPADLLSEELRRLDPDVIYAESIAGFAASSVPAAAGERPGQ
jgi:glucose-6-phosphate dehydrogenase assembly protein OpcA